MLGPSVVLAGVPLALAASLRALRDTPTARPARIGAVLAVLESLFMAYAFLMILLSE